MCNAALSWNFTAPGSIPSGAALPARASSLSKTPTEIVKKTVIHYESKTPEDIIGSAGQIAVELQRAVRDARASDNPPLKVLFAEDAGSGFRVSDLRPGGTNTDGHGGGTWVEGVKGEEGVKVGAIGSRGRAGNLRFRISDLKGMAEDQGE